MAATFLLALAHAALGGTVAFGVVWLLCRALPRLPAALRFALWWLVAARLLAGLPGAFAPVALPLLPARPAALSPPRAAVSPPAALRPAPSRSSPAPPPARMPASTADRVPNRPPAGRSAETLLLFVYAAGVLAVLAGQARVAARAHCLAAGAVPLDLPGAGPLARRLGLRRCPPLFVAAVPGPLLTGLWRPRILLPPGLTSAEALLAAAHEMAHLRRGDPALACVPALAQALFWFLPVAQAAAARCAASREEACDALALEAAGASPVAYGALLVRVATVRPTGGLGMASPGFAALRDRLAALGRRQRRLSPAAWSALALLAGPGLLSWRLVQAPAAPLPAALLPAAPETGVVPERFELVDIGTLGGLYSDAFAINDDGLVAGTASTGEGWQTGRAFLYDSRTARMRDLGRDERSRRSIAYAVNAAGEAAVETFQRPGFPRADRWSGGLSPVATLPQYPLAQALGINDAGALVGTARREGDDNGALRAQAFVADRDGVRALGTLGGKYSHAFAINPAGQVVGKADTAEGATHAALWDEGKARDLGTLPGGRNSRAHAIDRRGRIVGVSEAEGAHQAFFWEEGAMRPLPSLPDGQDAVAHAIADTGWIVGAAIGAEGKWRATLWLPDGSVRDLNALVPADSGWHLEIARGVNGRGEIVGQGVRGGYRRAFLLRPQRSPSHSAIVAASNQGSARTGGRSR